MKWLIKSLKPWSLLLLIAGLFCTHTASLFLSSLMLSMYYLYDEMTPHGQRVLVVTGLGLAPFTALISIKDVEDRLAGLQGITLIPETLVLGLVKDRPVLVRGVDFDKLKEYVRLEVVEGSEPVNSCINCAWIGVEAASVLGLKPGSTVEVYSVFSKTTLMFKIAGIVNSPPPYKYEVLVSRPAASALRGVSLSEASHVVVVYEPEKVNPLVLASRLGASLGEVEKGAMALFEKALIVLARRGGALEAYLSTPSEAYMVRLGIKREVVSAASLALSIVFLYAYYVVAHVYAAINKPAIALLYEIGLSRKRAALYIALIAATTSAALLALGLAAFSELSSTVPLYISCYRLSLASEPTAIAIIAALSTLVVVYGAFRGASREE
ncbi:MAG: hypothetical protein ACP5KA_06035 [Desulfurococcaceae archaeon]